MQGCWWLPVGMLYCCLEVREVFSWALGVMCRLGGSPWKPNKTGGVSLVNSLYTLWMAARGVTAAFAHQNHANRPDLVILAYSS